MKLETKVVHGYKGDEKANWRTDKLLKLSVGIEAVEGLIWDLEQALD